MRSKAIKTATLIVLCACLLLTACSKAEPIKTPIGSFDYSQTYVTSIQNRFGGTEGSAFVPAQGNIFLVVYLTPVGGSDVSLDEAQNYFQTATSAYLAGEAYELFCLAFEQIDGVSERIGLVFEVKDNGYEDAAEPPALKLELASAPQ